MAQQQSDFIDIPALMRQYVSKWYLFVASVIVCVALGWFYAWITPSRYEVKANVLIEQEGNKMPSLSDFSALLGTESQVDDEIFILSSHTSYSEVARNLNLNEPQVVRTGFLHSSLAFPNRPLEIQTPPMFCDTLYSALVFKFKLDGDGRGSVKVRYKDKKILDEDNITLPYTAKTRLGDITFNKSEFYPADGLKCTVGVGSYDAAAENLDKEIVCEIADKRSNVILMSIKTDNTAYGKAILDEVIDVYNRRGIKEQNVRGNQTDKFIGERLDLIARELSASEQAIQEYKQRNGLTDLPQDVKVQTERQAQIEGALLQAETEAAIIKITKDFVNDPSNEYALVPSTIENSGINQAVSQYNELLLKIMDLRANTQPGNKTLAKLEQQADAMRVTVTEAVNKAYASAMVKVNDLRREKGVGTALKETLPAKQREYYDIARQAQLQGNLYVYLLQRREENSMLMANASPKGIVIDRAYIVSEPLNMSKKLILVIAFLIGLCLPPIGLYIRKLLRNRFESRSEVERLTDVPILGEMSVDNSGRKLVVTKGVNSTPAELFRLIRSNLLFMLSRNDDKVVLVTSSTAGEGKSFISINLAATLAVFGKKVCLVGMDIRKPRLADYLGVKSPLGLTQYLSNPTGSIDKIIASVPDVPGLSVITAGPVPPNPSELLASSDIDELFHELRQMFDYIIVDSAPIGIVSDTFALDRVADASIFVCRVNYTPISEFKAINDIYANNRLKKLSLVVNCVESKKQYGYGEDHHRSEE